MLRQAAYLSSRLNLEGLKLSTSTLTRKFSSLRQASINLRNPPRGSKGLSANATCGGAELRPIYARYPLLTLLGFGGVGMTLSVRPCAGKVPIK